MAKAKYQYPYTKNKQAKRTYKIEPYKDLGFQAVEYQGAKQTGWRSNNHCAEELCQAEINKRKQQLANPITPVRLIDTFKYSIIRDMETKKKGKKQ